MFSPRNIPSDIRTLKEYLGDRRERKLAHNTIISQRMYHDEHVMEITYHDTVIARFYSDGSLMVKDGGYRTRTTFTRINAILGRRGNVYRENWVWHYSVPADLSPDPHATVSYLWGGATSFDS
jgi:hypothetical protein